MLKNDTLKNGTSRIGLYGSAPPPPGNRAMVPQQKSSLYLATVHISVVNLNKYSSVAAQYCLNGRNQVFIRDDMNKVVFVFKIPF